MSASGSVDRGADVEHAIPTRIPGCRCSRLAADGRRLPRREGTPLGLETDGRKLRPNAVAVPDARRVPGSGHRSPRPFLGPRSRASGREQSSATVGARIACVSSYYRFLIRMSLSTSNPCDALERPRSVAAVPRGYSAEKVLAPAKPHPRYRQMAGDHEPPRRGGAHRSGALGRSTTDGGEVLEYARSLPRLWAEAGSSGRQALTQALFGRLDVLGYQHLEFELSADALDLGLDTALPHTIELDHEVGEFGRGERI